MQIVAGADKILLITISKDVGTFQFSDYSDVTIQAYVNGTKIQEFTMDESLIPVSATEGVSGYEYSLTDDTNQCLVYLLGANTEDYADSVIKWQILTEKSDTHFSDDETYNDIYVKELITIIPAA